MNRTILVIALLVVAVAIALYFYWNPLKPSLPTYYVSLSEAWKNANYDQELLHEEPEALLELSPEQLATIKENLQSKKTSLKEGSEQSIADVYITFIDLAQDVQKLIELYTELGAVDDACASKSKYMDFTEQISRTNEKLRAYATKANELAKNYPEEAQQVHVFAVGNGYEKKIQDLDAIKAEIENALEVCT